MNLVVVESPTKARTIGRFLGKEYTIKASMGHVMDLPKSVLGVDVEHNFVPDYQLVSNKKSIIKELQEAAKSAEQIILATDPDREGEAIASHVKDMLGSSAKFRRIVFHEITKEAIEQALKNPRSIDDNLVDAQTARRVLDRLVGYKLSPLLWQKVRRGLSAGRVQSVALRLIVEREREIEKFAKEKYWTIHVLLARGPAAPAEASAKAGPAARSSQGAPSSLANAANEDARLGSPPLASPASPVTPQSPVEFELIEIDGEKIEQQEKFDLYDGEYRVTKTTITTQKETDAIVADLKTKGFVVSDVAKKEVRRFPHPPFTTSTLQQEAARRLGFSGKRTMRAAQKLYEEGFITYHRTDSVSVASSAVFAMRGFIEKAFGKKYLPEKPRFYKTKQKLAQEAHEAIRPTNAQRLASSVQLGNDHAKLYELIWRRAVASQMADALIESTTVLVETIPVILGTSSEARRTPESDSGQARMTKNSYLLKANGSVLLFDGFLKANPQALQERELPSFVANEQLSLTDVRSDAHETQPPPRYSEASLIKTLEEKGIGRPSTYAGIVDTIEGRRYVERLEGRFTPTPVGGAVNDFLVEHFATVDDISFTAEMEDDLDNIAHGKKEWVPVVRSFYSPFAKKVEEVKEKSKRVKIATEATDEICPTCGSNLVIRIGRFGKFFSCSKFPQCSFKKSYVEKTDRICPKDGGAIVVKQTRKGRTFFGCYNYPKCDFAAWKLEDIKNPN